MRFGCILFSLLLAAPALSAFGAEAPAAGTAPNPAQGRIFARTCIFCHGIEDYSVAYPVYHVPKVGGQREDYIVTALHEYAEGKRHFATMHAQAASLTNQQIRDIAAYFASLGPKPAPTNGNAKPPAFAATCAACHGARGVSTGPHFPSLAGQHSDYLLEELKQYKSGQRQNPIMNSMASSLTLQQMKELADYFGSQPPAVLTLPHPGPH